MNFNLRIITLTCFTLAACGPTAVDHPAVTTGAWEVDSAASDLTYVTIKAGDVVEVNSFETVSGSVSEDGAASIEIDLASVSTGIDIRDQRMRDIFFVVADNPTATVTAQIDPSAFETLQTGESTETTLDGTLSLRGVEAPFNAKVKVSRTGADEVLAVSSAPVIVDAADLELTDGLAQLQSIAGLDSITPTVSVAFSLTFTR